MQKIVQLRQFRALRQNHAFSSAIQCKDVISNAIVSSRSVRHFSARTTANDLVKNGASRFATTQSAGRGRKSNSKDTKGLFSFGIDANEKALGTISNVSDLDNKDSDAPNVARESEEEFYSGSDDDYFSGSDDDMSHFEEDSDSDDEEDLAAWFGHEPVASMY